MIHTNELMLGNWVEYATGLNNDKRSIPMYVTAIFDDEVYLDFPENDADPWEVRDEDLLCIPITEELLEKCGFQFNHRIENTVCFDVDDGFANLVNGETLTLYIRRFEYRVKYLHELQNVYFMLTKKHLEVKL